MAYKLSGDLAIFAVVSDLLSKLSAGGPKHANFAFMQLFDRICMRKSVESG